MSPELPYQMALTMVQGVGNLVAKNLISYCGGAEAVFKEKKNFLLYAYTKSLPYWIARLAEITSNLI